MKLFITCLLVVVLSLIITPLFVHAGGTEISISSEEWKAATDPCSPGGKFSRVGGGGAAPEKKEAPAGPAYPVDISDGSYYREVEQSDLPVVLEFWSPNCVHCRNMAGTVDELASELAGRVKVVKMNVKNNSEVPDKYKVNGIPAFFYVKGGNVAGSTVGSMSKAMLKRELGL